MIDARRAYLTRFLRMFMREVRWLWRRKADPSIPPQCRSCAFNPGTDSAKGFESTAKALLDALTEERPFYCHSGLPWRKPREEWSTEELQKALATARFCSGWQAIASFGPNRDDDGLRLAKRAVRRAGRMP